MYKLRLTRREKKKLLRSRWLVVFAALVGLGLVVWLVWVRPMQRDADIHSFDQCAAAGNPIQESYPEVCLTKEGKRFANPKQDAAHQASLTGNEILTPPTDPILLNLDIQEWGVRVPLTMQTFDLIYAYIKNGGDEYLLFTYKRLVQKGVCKGDIGLRLTRSLNQNQPPFSPNHPAPIAQVANYYYYVATAGSPCYDPGNADQAQLVKAIAGDQSLAQATASLVSKLIALPKD